MEKYDSITPAIPKKLTFQRKYPSKFETDDYDNCLTWKTSDVVIVQI